MTMNSPRANETAEALRGEAAAGRRKADRQVRLSLALSPKIADVLKGYAARHEVSITEAVRRAVSALNFIDEVQSRDDEKLAVARGDTVREIEFRW